MKSLLKWSPLLLLAISVTIYTAFASTTVTINNANASPPSSAFVGSIVLHFASSPDQIESNLAHGPNIISVPEEVLAVTIGSSTAYAGLETVDFDDGFQTGLMYVTEKGELVEVIF